MTDDNIDSNQALEHLATNLNSKCNETEANSEIIKKPNWANLGELSRLPIVLFVQLRVISDLLEAVADVDIEHFKERRNAVALNPIPNVADHVAKIECLEPVPVSVNAGLKQMAVTRNWYKFY